MSNNKVTLPPISDIFSNKNQPAAFAPQPAFAPYQRPMIPSMPSVPHYAGPAYPAMPVYSVPYSSPPQSYQYSMPYGNNSYTPYAVAPPAVAPQQPEQRPQGSLPLLHRHSVSSERRSSSVASPSSPGSPSSKSSTPETSGGATRTRTRNNLPKETTYILLKWLNDHLNHPYPNSFEKTQLMMTTGLNQQQLSNWFINARRRKIKVLREKQKPAPALASQRG